MVGSYCQEIVVAVADLGFIPAMTMDRTSRRRQGLQQSKGEREERTTSQQCKDDWYNQEREDVEEI